MPLVVFTEASPRWWNLGYFEEQVRTRYLSLVQMLQQAMRDTVQDFKRFALDTAVDLLARGGRAAYATAAARCDDRDRRA